MNLRAVGSVIPLALAGPAWAHAGLHHDQSSLVAGLLHPIGGTDHLLAMIAIGLWAAISGGRTMLALPASFLASMTAGFGLALAGVAPPMVEPAILGSLMVLGTLVALSVRLPDAYACALVAPMGLAHGIAHANELGGSSAPVFLVGFIVTTALLHLVGLIAGAVLARPGATLATRATGGIVCILGGSLIIAG
ncbi:urease accessory protein [Albidovulum inexpectatum]|uniref:Urease accessory protein n=1 Tax=Albidovulum inexpectatum TaxID=196587 RepID=A0A2S5JHN7_9RHOB|nr:HupE/UreJ family protein [Albidovulum inexpectatum]PPB80805.1 urease accessory protein [Albidovulum inexpectatum]